MELSELCGSTRREVQKTLIGFGSGAVVGGVSMHAFGVSFPFGVVLLQVGI